MKTLKINTYFVLGICTLLLFTHCNQNTQVRMAEDLELPSKQNFTKQVNGKYIQLFTLQNENGLRADITNFGGRIVSLLVPDKNGVLDDIVTGYHHIDDFMQSEEVYFGALIGRYGNRIAHATFSIDDQVYELNANNGPNHLHGGPNGFHNVVWDARQINDQTLELSYLSPHLEEGYPGNLKTTVTYQLSNDNELIIKYRAESDKKTVVNLTSHAFFNLAGESSPSILDHMLKINANYYTPVDKDLIPTGEISTVEGTPLDFSEYTKIGERIDQDHQQLIFGKGYDHNYVLNFKDDLLEKKHAASVYDPHSGRKMEVFTTEPGLQFYSGNFLTGNETGKRGQPYVFRSSFCLETQHFPDAPNQSAFPSTLLIPGEVYESETTYRFSVKK